MKNNLTKLIAGALLFIVAISGCEPTSNKDYSKIVGNPISIGNYKFAQYDFPTPMSWNAAQQACIDLGPGWRLPTQQELNILYQNKYIIGTYDYDYYWSNTSSSSMYMNNYGSAQAQNFIDGTFAIKGTENSFKVRAINGYGGGETTSAETAAPTEVQATTKVDTTAIPEAATKAPASAKH